MPTHWIVFSEKFNQPNLIPKKYIFPWISPTQNYLPRGTAAQHERAATEHYAHQICTGNKQEETTETGIYF